MRDPQIEPGRLKLSLGRSNQAWDAEIHRRNIEFGSEIEQRKSSSETSMLALKLQLFVYLEIHITYNYCEILVNLNTSGRIWPHLVCICIWHT